MAESTPPKRWLISQLKTSGSRRRYLGSPDYADSRHGRRPADDELLPAREGMRRSAQFFNGKIRYGLLLRFLRGQVGQPWAAVHAEILARIPTRLLPYRDLVYWFVADQVELLDGRHWDRREQKFLTPPGKYAPKQVWKEFYVDPATGRLCRSPR